MAEGTPISLDKKVVIREDQVEALQRLAKTEGVIMPRKGKRFYLGAAAVIDMANRPVDIPVEAYQESMGNKHAGRVLHAQEREEAFAVRKQFSQFFEEAPSKG
jgi:hypothetical protein